jgi:hypothetical protein
LDCGSCAVTGPIAGLFRRANMFSQFGQSVCDEIANRAQPQQPAASKPIAKTAALVLRRTRIARQPAHQQLQDLARVIHPRWLVHCQS